MFIHQNTSKVFVQMVFATLFFACAAEKQVSQEDFLKNVKLEASHSKNTLLASIDGICDTTRSKTATVKVTNEDLIAISCNVKEYDFLHTKINIDHPSEYKFEIEPEHSYGVGIRFEKNFPKRGVVMVVSCNGQGKIFKDVALITCKG